MKVASLEALVRALNDADVPFIVVGGLAVNAHGYGRFTQDVDLVVRLEPVHVLRLFGALSGLGYRPLVPVTAEGFADPGQRAHWVAEKGMTVLNFHSDAHQETPVDIFATEPFDFQVEHARALLVEVGPGLPMRVLNRNSLISLKRAAGRLQDLADVAELEQLGGPGRP